MRIISLQAENIKRLVAVSIEPDGNIVEITGKNGAGKTSVLDAIYWALAGKDGVQSTPIRKGEDQAIIKLDLGDLKVTRKFKASEDGGYATSIAVESADGARFPSPQSMLDALVGSLSFDPLGFVRLKPADQLQTLKQFVTGVDFAAIEKANKADFDDRTILNRKAKEAHAQADAEPTPGPKLTAADVSELIAQLESAGQVATEIERRKAGRARASDSIASHQSEGRSLSARVAALHAQIKNFKNEAAQLTEQMIEELRLAGVLEKKLLAVEPLPEMPDTSAIKDRIEEAHKHNAAVAEQAAAQERVRAARETAAAAEKAAKDLTKKMEDRKASVAKAISDAALPVPGIVFDDGAVLLDGLPFDQASDAQQLRASIAIAAAMNPKLRVIRVRDGSLLDKDSMTLLAEFAQASDMQVWIETVQSGRHGAIVIEDGMVVA
ncbi:MAG: AAA family ATPase [Alphaproteobacteria bacterium]